MAGVNISGDITVANPEDFAEPTFSYNFGGNGSQILDTGIWNKNGDVDEEPEITGIGFVGSLANITWDSAVVAKRVFLRSNAPRLEWDFKILKTDTSDNRYEMLGWGESSTMTSHGNQAYAIYVNTDDIYWRTHSSGGNGATAALEEEEFSAVQAAYNLGGMTIAASMYEADNLDGVAAAKYEETELSVSFAF